MSRICVQRHGTIEEAESMANQYVGRTQQLILHVLASQGPCTIKELAYHWPTLTQSAASSAVNRLGNRGFVDLADRSWDGARSYSLTRKGAEVERALLTLDESDD
jgi:DNA-binding MarR family transcriptional regulator